MENKNIVMIGIAILAVGAIAWALSGSGSHDSEQMAASLDQAQAAANDDLVSGSQKAKEGNSLNSTSETANNTSSGAPQMEENYKKIMNATIKTSLGEMKVELYGDRVPQTAGNFAKLGEAGFYNGIKFHRVIKGFMIQGGDPLTKDDAKKSMWGTGGPGYKFADEKFEGSYTRGILAMANSGPNTNGSQFFIMHQDYPLPPSYVIFGKVTSGIEIVDKIAELPTDARDCPLEPPVIESVIIAK